MALEQNKQCFLHRGLCPRTPGVFSLAIQGVTFHLLLSKKRATPGWCYSPHSTTLRFGTLSSVAHTLMWHIDHISASAPVQSPLKHLQLLLPAFQVARFTRSAPHQHLLFQVTLGMFDKYGFDASVFFGQSSFHPAGCNHYAEVCEGDDDQTSVIPFYRYRPWRGRSPSGRRR